MRSTCATSEVERAAMRTIALAELANDSGGWAARSWDGPLANFPGASHSDTGRPRIVKLHKRRDV